jgi:hypothetical protein
MMEDSSEDRLPVPHASSMPGFVNHQGRSRFDYGALPSYKANELSERRDKICGAVRKTIDVVIAIGRDLIAAKKLLGHGSFIDWVEKECGFQARTAQNYMAISKLSVKYEFVAHLPVETALRLARMPGRRLFLEKISNAGRSPTEDEILALRDKFRKMRQLQPKRAQGRKRKNILEPTERPSPSFGGGRYKKSEWAKMNAELMKRLGGMESLLLFQNIVATDTVVETLTFVRVEVRRWEFECGLVALQNPAAEE